MPLSKEPPPFDELADFIRQVAGISPEKRLVPDTQFEYDLGITGDDGVELLEAVEAHFGIPLTDETGNIRPVFGLGPNEYLFHSEGWYFPTWWFGWGEKPIIRAFTVGELHAALRAQCQS